MQGEKILRLTVDLYYESEPVPATRMQFFGANRAECLAQLDDQAERDPALKALANGRDEYQGLRLRESWKTIELHKVARGLSSGSGAV